MANGHQPQVAPAFFQAPLHDYSISSHINYYINYSTMTKIKNKDKQKSLQQNRQHFKKFTESTDIKLVCQFVK